MVEDGTSNSVLTTVPSCQLRRSNFRWVVYVHDNSWVVIDFYTIPPIVRILLASGACSCIRFHDRVFVSSLSRLLLFYLLLATNSQSHSTLKARQYPCPTLPWYLP
jgi:hypothetical protein